MPTIANGTGATLAVEGAEIYFEVGGDPTGPPLLLLHGGMGTIEDFAPLLQSELAEAYHLIAVESRGHGRSTLGAESLTYERLERDVVAVLRHLGIDRTALLGFSVGGVVGYRLMASGTISIPKLITIGARHELRPDDPARPILANVTAQSWLERFPGADASYRRINPQPDFEKLVDSVVEMWLDTGPTGYPGSAVEQLDGALLVMRGDGDHLFSRRAAVELVDQVQGATLANIPFGGHAVHAERPRVVTEFILEFLSRAA